MFLFNQLVQLAKPSPVRPPGLGGGKALIFKQTAVLGHFMLKWSVKVFLSDPTLILALPSQSVSLVEFFSSNCWICHSGYMDFTKVVKWICQKEYMDFSNLLYIWIYIFISMYI